MANDPSFSKNFDLVENLFSNRDYEINISIPEFTCVCPKTGQPDYAIIEINYIPNKSIVELKSLKKYLQQYRDVGIFHETVTNKILDDFRRACQPRKIEVIGRFNTRGGINTIVNVRWPEEFV